MPTAAIKSFAEKTGKSVAEIEKYWNEAKEAAKSEKAKGDDAFYGTAMVILKNKLKKHAGLKEERTTLADYLRVGTPAHMREGKLEDVNFIESFVNEGRARERGINESDVDEKELAMGIIVEYEHTDNADIARRIALDHLAELPDYYTRLARMEAEGKKAMKDK